MEQWTAKMRTFLENSEEKRRSRLADLHSRAAGDAERITAYIRDTFHPKRIVQWGSVVELKNFRDYSDIDIAVEGISGAESFFALLHHVDGMTSFPVDIVQLEHIEPEYRPLILGKGKVVYER